MNRLFVYPVLLTLCLSLRYVPLAMALHGSPAAVQPRVSATVTVREPRGLATIRTAHGTTYTVLKGTTWHVGDTVECEQRDSMGIPSWQALDCRKIS